MNGHRLGNGHGPTVVRLRPATTVRFEGSTLVDEDLAEARAHAAVLARDDRRDRRERRPKRPAVALEQLLADLETRTREGYTLRRVALGAYEARTWAGDVGIGASHTEAVEDLLDELAAGGERS